MKTINRLQYIFLSLLVTGSVLTGCKSDTVPFNISPSLTVEQPQPEDITRTTAHFVATVRKDLHNSYIQQVGIQCATNSAFTEDGDLRTITTKGVNESDLNHPLLVESNKYQVEFYPSVGNLRPNTRYWVRSYAMSDTLHPEIAMAYSESIVFTTPATSAPSFEDVTVGSPLPTSVPISVTISDMGSELLTYEDVTLSGYLYKRITNATEASNLRTQTPGVKTVLKFPDEEGRLDTVLTDLVPGALYAVRAFAVAEGTGYSEVKTFQAQQTSLPAVSVARNTGAQSVGQVNLSADVIAAGSSSISARGFVYSRTETTPQLIGSTVVSCPVDESETFSATISNLSVGTTYYIRAYATNSAGTGYSSEVLQVRLTGEIKAPTVSLISVSLTTSQDETAANMAEMVGFLASNGGGAVEEIGFELSEFDNMEGAERFHGDLDANNMFRAISYQLAAGTTYYIRAFAQNSAGTAYSEIKTVTTPYSQNSVPSVVTVQPEDISTTFAVLGGYVRNEGGSPIRAVGFQVSKSQDMSDPIVVDANANDQLEFMREIHNLEPNTTYYVRAFAENETGMGYGNIRTFTTVAEINVPNVKTMDANPASTSAELIGMVENNGGGEIRNAGFELSTEPSMANPTTYPGTLDANKVQFHTSAGNLQPSTTYYVRAYAVNDAGTGYGETVSFTTLEPETVTPGEGDNPYPSQGGVKGQRKAKATTKR